MSIELVKINYSYNGRKKTSLSDISLEIKAGDSIGFMGPSGSGKTTLIDILLGLLTPEKGLILYNGQPLNSHISEWNAHVSYLPQEVFLVDGTLQSNIAFGMKKDKVDNLRLNDAIQKSQLDELVSQLDQGVDTLVGERGVQLSGGQRQRIALARAFYHERDVLIMDESTSAMDNEIEAEILKEILRLKEKKTVIIIAHRLTTLQHCDRIYKIMNGKIVEFGSYEELVLNSI
jgi:ABC-type multidrug transport system fused ATPase/permease subunit